MSIVFRFRIQVLSMAILFSKGYLSGLFSTSASSISEWLNLFMKCLRPISGRKSLPEGISEGQALASRLYQALSGMKSCLQQGFRWQKLSSLQFINFIDCLSHQNTSKTNFSASKISQNDSLLIVLYVTSKYQQILMFGEFNGSSYYRANPYYQQGYLPDTALKNRKMPSYMTEIPQGEQHFEPSNKKHFQRLGYYSTIADEHIMNPDPAVSPSREKAFFGNLNVDDIEGANTNTLISKAVKNRLKAKQYLAERERQQRENEVRSKMRYLERVEDDRKRLQALSKINQATQPNYHEKIMKMRTEESEKQSPPPLKQQELRPERQLSTNNHQKSHFQMELQKTQREIRELQDQLRTNKHEIAPKQPNYYHQVPKQMRQSPFYEQQKYELMKNSLPQPHRREEGYPSTQRRQSPPEIPLKYSERQNYEENQRQSGHNVTPPYQNSEIERYRNYSGSMEPPGKLRSLTDHPQPNGQQYYIQEEQREGELKRNIETPIYDQRNEVRQTRQQHRRINPTFLSYGSGSIGLAGRNIMGY